MSEKSSMPPEPCNTGCPRSPEGRFVKGAAWVLRKITATPDGCGSQTECFERHSRRGLPDYRGDQTYLRERFGELPPPPSTPPIPPTEM